MAERSILIACIGNIFQGDDGFGVEVARQLASRQFPENVRVVDFGIRSFDLAFALMDDYDTTIFVDAMTRGDKPGTIYVIEPDLKKQESQTGQQEQMFDAHSMNPVKVLEMARSMGAEFKRLLVVGCEPETIGGDEGLMGLSESVQKAIDKAIEVIERLVADICVEKHNIVSV